MANEPKETSQVEVSIVLPAHNEADILDNAVETISQALKQHGNTYEIIIAEDGSTDGTDIKAAELAKTVPFVRHIHGEKRVWRGQAFKNTFKMFSVEVLVGMGVDLATDIKYL